MARDAIDAHERVVDDARAGLQSRGIDMPRMIQCVHLGQESEGLDRPPFKGPLGERVFEQISKQAWRAWLEHSKMLINEYRLDLTSPDGQRIWMRECEKYFFGEGSEAPPEFVPKS